MQIVYIVFKATPRRSLLDLLLFLRSLYSQNPMYTVGVLHCSNEAFNYVGLPSIQLATLKDSQPVPKVRNRGGDGGIWTKRKW